MCVFSANKRFYMKKDKKKTDPAEIQTHLLCFSSLGFSPLYYRDW